jgi:hypothetical protein
MKGWWDDGSIVVCCYENGPLNVLPPPNPLSLSLSPYQDGIVWNVCVVGAIV